MSDAWDTAIVATSLDQEDGEVGISRSETTSNDAARGTASSNDDVNLAEVVGESCVDAHLGTETVFGATERGE